MYLGTESSPDKGLSIDRRRPADTAGIASGCGSITGVELHAHTMPDSKTVDPLSLTLSLQNDSDERVLGALEELQEHFPGEGTRYFSRTL